MYLEGLDNRVDKELSRGNLQFMKDIRKSAKLRAPRDTAKTAKSIRLEQTKTQGKTKQWKLIVDSRAGYFQEIGFKPHWIFVQRGYVYDKHGKSDQRTRKLPDGFHWVSKNKPFIRPAVEKNLSKYSQMSNKALRRALRKKWNIMKRIFLRYLGKED